MTSKAFHNFSAKDLFLYANCRVRVRKNVKKEQRQNKAKKKWGIKYTKRGNKDKH